jgi:hypothetical protein
VSSAGEPRNAAEASVGRAVGDLSVLVEALGRYRAAARSTPSDAPPSDAASSYVFRARRAEMAG